MGTTANTAATQLDIRQQKAIQIAKTARIARRGDGWFVPSQTKKGGYFVHCREEHGAINWSCTCAAFDTCGDCKHIRAVVLVRYNSTPDGPVPDVRRVTYRQDWPKYDLAQTHEKRLFTRLLRDLVAPYEHAPQRMGRPRLPLRDLLYASCFKVYTTLSCRRAASDIVAAQEQGFIDCAPHRSSIFRLFGKEAITPTLSAMAQQSAHPLLAVETDFAVDSTGLGTVPYLRWFDTKYGTEKKAHAFVKVHAVCGVRTNVVTAVVATHGNSADSPEFVGLVNTTAENGFKVRTVAADKAYSSYENLQRVVDLGGTPFVPFKAGTGEGVGAPETWRKLHHFFAYHRSAFLNSYHQRSNVESTFSMLKRKFGPSIRSKSATAQLNETLMRIICHNIVVVIHEVFELGIKPDFWPRIDTTDGGTQ